MSTSSMGWQPVVEAPGSKLAEAMAMRLLEQKLQGPEDEWKRQLAERQLSLQEKTAESEMGLGERAAELAEKRHGLEREKLGQDIWSQGLDYTLRSEGQQIQRTQAENTNAWHQAQIEAQKEQMGDMRKWRDKRLELEGIELDLKRQQIQGQLDYRRRQLSMDGVEHAQKLVKEGTEKLADPVWGAMAKRVPGLIESVQRGVTRAQMYLEKAEAGGILEKVAEMGREPIEKDTTPGIGTVKEALQKPGTRPTATVGQPSATQQIQDDYNSGRLSKTMYDLLMTMDENAREQYLRQRRLKK